MKKVLITGAGGFIGSNLVRKALELNNEVFGIVKEERPYWRLEDLKDKIRLYYIDLGDSERVNKTISEIKPEIIYHLAVHQYHDQNLEKIINTNFIGTTNLLQAALKQGFELFVNTGTSSEYGSKEKIMAETDFLEPNSYYAITKAASSLFCKHIGKEKNLPIATLRLFSVYGPFEEKNRFIPQIIMSSLNNNDVNLASQKNVRDFVYVDDAVNAYFNLEKNKPSPGEIYNVASGQQYTLKEVMDIVMKKTGSESKLLWGAYPDRPWDKTTIVWQGDISKISRIGWRPQISIEHGLEKSIDWFKNNLDKYK
jgi:nucleoside-diphosphate-sugar epimerase